MVKYYLAYKDENGKYNKVDITSLGIGEDLKSIMTFLDGFGCEEELSYYLSGLGKTKNIEKDYAIVRMHDKELIPIPNCNISHIMNDNRLFSYQGIEGYLYYRKYDMKLWDTLLLRSIRRYKVTDKLYELLKNDANSVSTFYLVLDKLLKYHVSSNAIEKINVLIDYMDQGKEYDSRYNGMVYSLFETLKRNDEDLLKFYSLYSGALYSIVPSKVSILRRLQNMCLDAKQSGRYEFEQGYDHDNNFMGVISDYLKAELYTFDKKTNKNKLSYSALCNLGMSISDYEEKCKKEQYIEDNGVAIIDPVTDEYMEMEDFAGIDPELTLEDIEGMGYEVKRRGI